jgi:hypothetical protein
MFHMTSLLCDSITNCTRSLVWLTGTTAADTHSSLLRFIILVRDLTGVALRKTAHVRVEAIRLNAAAA